MLIDWPLAFECQKVNLSILLYLLFIVLCKQNSKHAILNSKIIKIPSQKDFPINFTMLEKRYILATLAFFTTFNVYSLRNGITVSILKMATIQVWLEAV